MKEKFFAIPRVEGNYYFKVKIGYLYTEAIISNL